MVSGTISLFLSKCFSPFPHGTGPLSVSQEYLALPDGPGGFAQNYSCSALLRIPLCCIRLHVRDCHPLWFNFPKGFHSPHAMQCRGPTTPNLRCHRNGLGCSPFARHYWGNHCLFSIPAGTKMFQFPALAPTPSAGDRPSDGRVVPFGNLRIKGHLHLPEAYRSLSRPSSPL